MAYRTYIPRLPLSDFVHLFWSYEGYDAPNALERVVPDGAMQLIFGLGEAGFRVYDRSDTRRFDSLGGSVISGAHSQFVVVGTAGLTSTVGVHFKAGGARPFLGVSADELRDADVPLDVLWGRGGKLRDRLLEAEKPEERFRLLEMALLARATCPLTRHPAVAFALEEFERAPRTITVREVGERTGLSQRRFIKLFREEVGLTPKLFCRIRRFQEVLRLIGGKPSPEWADAALGCGYFDQSHLIHDFRAFAGTTPTDYLARRGEHPNHVAL